MSTYILIHNSRRSESVRPEAREVPDQEIAENIRAGRRATTDFGGWSIRVNKLQIRPGDRLLFYRSGEGFFAVGKALPAADLESRKLRKKMLGKLFPNNPDTDKLGEAINPGLAAYEATDWEKGEGKTVHINAEWDAVADLKTGVLVPFNINDFGNAPKSSGFRIPDESEANDICAKCMNAPNALHAK